MVLPSSGPLSLNDIAGEFGGSVPHSLNEYYSAATGIPASGTIAIGNFYGKSAVPDTGYFGGGTDQGSGLFSRMDKVTYSTDTTAAVPGANLTENRSHLAATGNSTAGYFGGGSIAANSRTTIMNKVTYSTDTTAAVPGANLKIGRLSPAATGNSTAGYFGGGQTVPLSTQTDKLTYSTDTTAAVPGASLPKPTFFLSATGNSTAGYFGGGSEFTAPFASISTTMSKVTYSTDTTAAVPGANLSLARQSLAAASAKANGLA